MGRKREKEKNEEKKNAACSGRKGEGESVPAANRSELRVGRDESCLGVKGEETGKPGDGNNIEKMGKKRRTPAEKNKRQVDVDTERRCLS